MMKKGSFTVSMISVIILFLLVAHSFGGEVKLMFPEMTGNKITSKDGESLHFYSEKQYKGKTVYSETSLADFVRELEQTGYHVDYIELWVKYREESNGVTRLFISPTSTGGCKIYLQPHSHVERKRVQPTGD